MHQPKLLFLIVPPTIIIFSRFSEYNFLSLHFFFLLTLVRTLSLYFCSSLSIINPLLFSWFPLFFVFPFIYFLYPPSFLAEIPVTSVFRLFRSRRKLSTRMSTGVVYSRWKTCVLEKTGSAGRATVLSIPFLSRRYFKKKKFFRSKQLSFL